MFDHTTFRATQIPAATDKKAIAAAAADYRLILGASMEMLITRFEQNRDYPFIDTKVSTYDGHEFADDPLRGKGVIYTWIQGRGLEALAGHYQWLRRNKWFDNASVEDLAGRMLRMMGTVLSRMEALRNPNAGRLSFMMTPEGIPLRMGADGYVVPQTMVSQAPPGFSDIFYVKGMVAAANLLKRPDAISDACQWFLSLCDAIESDRLVSDQQPLDPKNVGAQIVAGRLGQGVRMLAIGGAALFLDITGDVLHLDRGLAFIDHILARHVNSSGRAGFGLPYDMWEYVDSNGKPWLSEKGELLSDPGHATEFAGLSLKLLRVAERRGLLSHVGGERLGKYREVLPNVLTRNYDNGFSSRGYGLCKTFDVLSRKALNTDMPWWSLPETMRGAIEAARFADPIQCPALAKVAVSCSNAFLRHYVRPDLRLMAYQTLDAEGRPVDVIPATPDADPGYHTGLSLIDVLDVLDELMARKVT